MVLIKAAGHTPGSQMVYVVLDSRREYLLIGDAAWHMDGVRQVTGKAAPWITETNPPCSINCAAQSALDDRPEHRHRRES
jgi:hypothetical protein